jgi:hypothetical protein
MVERGIRIVAILASLVLVSSFTVFAIDELNGASAVNEAKLDADLSAPASSSDRHQPAQGSVRTALDDANNVLVAPFDGLASTSTNHWVRRGVPALIALLIWGLGLGFLSRYMRGRGGGRPRWSIGARAG